MSEAMTYKLPPLPEREAFEAWMKDDATISLEKDGHGYVDMTAELMWHAWKARAAIEAQGVPDSLREEAANLASILSGMVEGGYSDLETLYTEDQSDGDAFVKRAAEVLGLFASAPPAPQAEPEGACATCGALKDDQIIKQAAVVQQQPVAWANPNDMLDASTSFRWIQIGEFTQPLYTHPAPQQKPLTDEHIDELAISSSNRGFVRASNRFIQEFARAIEAAHNIGEKK